MAEYRNGIEMCSECTVNPATLWGMCTDCRSDPYPNGTRLQMGPGCADAVGTRPAGFAEGTPVTVVNSVWIGGQGTRYEVQNDAGQTHYTYRCCMQPLEEPTP